ncbi:hypothetical protein AX13_10760 [Comamonas aquatica DA1877]|uniref:Uncharacterized protein n=1 Tax=Comamonas aquatica DA1877 TaxID=1457173 RepID=A0A014MI36_9BURK|nr:hypothetical protein AX13_10760 [Comamonas aquatica DA1877]
MLKAGVMAGREGGKSPHLRRSFWWHRWRGCAGSYGAVCRWGADFSGRAVAGVWLAGGRSGAADIGAQRPAFSMKRAGGLQYTHHQRRQLWMEERGCAPTAA